MLFQMSFLHRLHDDFPGEEFRETLNQHTRQDVLNSLIRDLSMLFSSRSVPVKKTLYAELERSIVNYGIADVVDVDIVDDERIKRLRENIFNALHNFEPRLKNVVIKLQNNSPENIVFWVEAFFYGERVLFSVRWCTIAYTYSIVWAG